MFDAEEWITTLHTSNRGQRIMYRTLELSDQESILNVSRCTKQVKDERELLKKASELTKFLTNMDISSNYRIRYGQLIEDYVRCERMATQLRSRIIEFAVLPVNRKNNV